MMSVERSTAVDRWYRTHVDAVRRYALRRVGPDHTDEVVSDVFVAALTTSSLQPDDDEALPWLYAIARNVVGRARYRHVRRAELLSGLCPERGENASPDIAGPIVSRDWVRSVLDSLDDDAAELLSLVVWEGLDTASAAKVLGIRPGTARVRLHRLRRRIQRQLPADALTRLTEGGDAT